VLAALDLADALENLRAEVALRLSHRSPEKTLSKLGLQVARRIARKLESIAAGDL
jgi:hypothetical protein